MPPVMALALAVLSALLLVALCAGSWQESSLACCLSGACPPCQAPGGFHGKAKRIFSSQESCMGPGESASRRQRAKPCCESAWPINI